MKKLRSSFLALAGLAFVATAHAGTTTLPPSPIVETTTPGNLYFTVAGGALWLQDVDNSGINVDFDTGFSVLGAIGYKFDYGLSIELESGYMQADLGGVSVHGAHADLDGQFEQVPIMVNAVYWAPISDRLSFYIGAGTGIVWSQTSVDHVGHLDVSGLGLEDSDWNFAAQAKAGLSIKVCPQGSLNIGYRFFWGNDAVAGFDDSLGHVLEGGFTWWF
jgi:opacity protein-like surface antigen